jgi:hypothetical protein
MLDRACYRTKAAVRARQSSSIEIRCAASNPVTSGGRGIRLAKRSSPLLGLLFCNSTIVLPRQPGAPGSILLTHTFGAGAITGSDSRCLVGKRKRGAFGSWSPWLQPVSRIRNRVGHIVSSGRCHRVSREYCSNTVFGPRQATGKLLISPVFLALHRHSTSLWHSVSANQPENAVAALESRSERGPGITSEKISANDR